MTAATSVAEPEAATQTVESPAAAGATKRATKDDSKPKRQPRYHVVLWNDDDHTYQYVIAMLQKLFGHPPEKGFLLAKEVDSQGRVIVLTTTLEHAELKRDQIHAYGKDDLVAGSKGSMRATLEAAE